MCSLSRLYIFCALLLSLTACGNIATDKGSTPIASPIPTPSENPQDVVVIGEADGAPIGCSPDDITARIAKMFDAINRGDPTVVDEFFGRKSSAPFSGLR